MDARQIDEGIIMEGWLYLIRSNTIGFKYSRKLYYVLQNHHFKSFKSIPHFYNEDPIRSAIVDSLIHVVDNGRKCIRGKVFFVFTLCDTSNYDAHVKLGANNQEDAARWIKSFQELSQKVDQNPGNFLGCPRSNYSGKICDKNDVDDILSLDSIMDPKTSDIFEPSYWTIFGCHNGLRLFKQARYQEDHNKRDGNPALAAVSVMEGTPEVIFQILMSLGSSRSQWDFCFQKGSVIENIDSHTDIIHKQLDGDWLPWGMKPRDLLLHRYWKTDENGTYFILYHSVLHKKCPLQKGVIRACVKFGGYVISPVNQYKQSVVRHMLAIDWKFWGPYLQKSSSKCLTIRMLERLAALRELVKTNLSDCLFTSQELKKDSLMHYNETSMKSGVVHLVQDPSNIVKMDDQTDEFFDFDDESESECNYIITLPEDQTGNMLHSWSSPEASLFQIRGESFLEDRKKITAESTLLQTVAIDWLKSDKREDDLASRHGNIVHKYAADGRPEFFLVVNFQVPGSTHYNLASYHMTRTPIKDIPLLEKFIKGDDAFRNSRFKIIPQVSKGPWILRHAIRRPTLIGHMLKINYIHGNNYLEIDVDVGSSACARGLAGKTFSCFNNLIIEIGFVIQANTRDELPEHLAGAFRLSHVDLSKACWAYA
ncbi:hypothetical protein L1887_09977 [Cichorium endivia]|nr:hypothetical protein L1887_09977 [Cichorium endivia]